jgi:hypothetical protein
LKSNSTASPSPEKIKRKFRFGFRL